MKINCIYCQKKYATGRLAKGERDSKDVLHKGMGVFACKKPDMACQIIQDNLPTLV